MTRRTLKYLLAASILVPSLSSAQQVLTRTDLNGILVSSSTETFSGFTPLAPGNATGIHSGGTDVTVLDNSTVTDEFGAGAVSALLRFITPGGNLQANGTAYFGSASENLNANGGPLSIFFLSAVNAVGVDLFDFAGYASPFSVSAFGPGNTLLGTVNFAGTNAPASEFFGWKDAGGIDHLEVGATNGGSWSSLVDNVTFGHADLTTATPEPASLVLMATGFLGLVGVARRKRNA